MPAVIHPMPWGLLHIEEKDDALTMVRYLRPEERPEYPLSEMTPLLREACAQLDAYFAGRLRRFSLPISPMARPFSAGYGKSCAA